MKVIPQTIEQKASVLAQLLKTLANQNRLLILCALRQGPLTVGEIGQRIPAITGSAISQHLNSLKAHGILDCEKKAQNVTYRIADKRVLEIMETLKKNYCT